MVRILWRVLETWGDLLSDISEKLTKRIIIMIIIIIMRRRRKEEEGGGGEGTGEGGQI